MKSMIQVSGRPSISVNPATGVIAVRPVNLPGAKGEQGIQGAAGAALVPFWADAIQINASMALNGYDTAYLITTATVASITLQLPTAVGKKGRLVAVKNKSAFDAHIITQVAGQKIDDLTTGLTLPGDGDCRWFMSDGANWESLGSNGSGSGAVAGTKLSEFASLAAAVAAIGATPDILNLNAASTVTANLTLPATLDLQPTPGNLITINNGVTLTLPKALPPVDFAVFNCVGSGKVLFPPGTTVDIAWFGADLSGNNVSTAALTSAIASISKGGEIYSRGILKTASPTYPNWWRGEITLNVWGWLDLVGTFVQPVSFHVVGHAGGYNTQFQVGAVAGINPPANLDTAWVIGEDNSSLNVGGRCILKNIAIGTTGDAIGPMVPRAAFKDAIRLNGVMALTASIHMENVGSYCPNGRPITNDGAFWVWMKRCYWMSSGPDTGAMLVTTSAAPGGAPADYGQYSTGGLMFLDDCILAGRGILVRADRAVNNQGAIYARNLHFESMMEEPLTLDSTHGNLSGITFEQVAVSDSVLQTSKHFINVTGDAHNIVINNSFNLYYPEGLVGGTGTASVIFNGDLETGYTTGWNMGQGARLGWSGMKNRYLFGDFIGDGDPQSPALIPGQPLNVPQSAEVWGTKGMTNTDSATGHRTIMTGGITAPDGTPTAIKLSTTIGNGSISLYLAGTVSNIVEKVGDFYIYGGWVKCESATMPAIGGPSFDLSGPGFTMEYAPVYTTTPLNERSASWKPIAAYNKIKTIGAGVPDRVFAIRAYPDQPMSYWHPFVVHIPAGSMAEDDMIRLVRSLKNINCVGGGVPGSIALGNQQKLMLSGGVRLSSTSGVPTSGTFYAGKDHIKNVAAAIGQPKGWVCTRDGGRFSVVRANATPYKVGVWAQWSTGETIWEAIHAGLSGAAAPDITGLTVGGQIIDGEIPYEFTGAYAGAWAANTVYAIGAVVSHNGILYKMLYSEPSATHRSGITPPVFTSGLSWDGPCFWQYQGAASGQPAWAAGTDYTAGQIVSSNGGAWRCLRTNRSGTIAPVGVVEMWDGDATNRITWQVISTTYAGQWVTATPYAANAVVTNGGNSYRILYAGTSSAVPPTHVDGVVGGVVWVMRSLYTTTLTSEGNL